MLMTPLMLKKNWNVTSVIRDPAHRDEILQLNEDGHEGKVDVLLSSLEDLHTAADATAILDKVKPNYVVWSAGEHRPQIPLHHRCSQQELIPGFR